VGFERRMWTVSDMENDVSGWYVGLIVEYMTCPDEIVDVLSRHPRLSGLSSLHFLFQARFEIPPSFCP
jgi:hypothetical protein